MKKVTIAKSMVLILVLAGVLMVGASVSGASDWPKRPITLVIPFSPGGATDLIGRALKPHMEKILGVPMAATNMPGAATAVGHQYVWDAPHDGYTLLVQPTDIVSIAVMGQSKFTYKDWQILGVAAAVPAAFVVHPDSPFKSLKDLVTEMHRRSVTVAVAGAGCAWSRATALMSRTLGTKPPQLVPMGGGYPAAVSAMKKEVDVGACGLPEAIELIRGKKVRVLAYWGAEDYLDKTVGVIPSIASIFPEFKGYLPFGGWVGMALPKGTPSEVVDKTQRAFDYAIGTPEFKKFCEDNTFLLLGLTGKDAVDFVARSTSVNAWLLYDLGIATLSPSQFDIPKP